MNEAELDSQKQLEKSVRTILPAKENRSLEMARVTTTKEEKTQILTRFLLLSPN